MPPCAGFLPSSFQQIFEGQHQALSRYLERHQISEATRLSLHICRVTRPESDDVYFKFHFESFRAHFYLSLRYSCNCFRCGRGSVAGEGGRHTATLPHCHTVQGGRPGGGTPQGSKCGQHTEHTHECMVWPTLLVRGAVYHFYTCGHRPLLARPCVAYYPQPETYSPYNL